MHPHIKLMEMALIIINEIPVCHAGGLTGPALCIPEEVNNSSNLIINCGPCSL